MNEYSNLNQAVEQQNNTGTPVLTPTAPAPVTTKKCLCGATISSKYERCMACNDKLKARAGNDKFLEVLDHINWNLGIIAQCSEKNVQLQEQVLQYIISKK